jgi:hypothetical protein
MSAQAVEDLVPHPEYNAGFPYVEGDFEHQDRVTGTAWNGYRYADPEWPDFVRPMIVHTQARAFRENIVSEIPMNNGYVNQALPNHEVGGVPGLVDSNASGEGTVDSARMEKFELRGRQVRIRRRAENSRGPVGQSDNGSRIVTALSNAAGPGLDNAQLAMALLQGSY